MQERLNENDQGTIHPTRHKLLGYQHQGPRIGGTWRIIDRQTGQAIGPQYVCRCELLADLDRFAEVYGGGVYWFGLEAAPFIKGRIA